MYQRRVANRENDDGDERHHGPVDHFDCTTHDDDHASGSAPEGSGDVRLRG
jgi:hypothetical protein